jgi:hypothetical protein
MYFRLNSGDNAAGQHCLNDTFIQDAFLPSFELIVSAFRGHLCWPVQFRGNVCYIPSTLPHDA